MGWRVGSLYRNPKVLVLDEATSALDNETEKEVMEAIDGLHGTRTLIVIAHRLSTIKNCDEIYEVSNGKIVIVDFPLTLSPSEAERIITLVDEGNFVFNSNSFPLSPSSGFAS